MNYLRPTLTLCLILSAGLTAAAQSKPDERAAGVISKAIQLLGGDRYLQVKSQVGRGKYSVIKDNALASFQSFLDVIVFPDKERTEFKNGGSKTVQTNTGKTGWIYDGDQELIKVQNDDQVTNFLRAIRVSLDNLLRGYWHGQAELTYVGRRPASLGKRRAMRQQCSGFNVVTLADRALHVDTHPWIVPFPR